MSLFVSKQEIEELTGCKTSAAQRFVLKRRRIKYFDNAIGFVLTRAEYERVPTPVRPTKLIPTIDDVLQLPSMPRQGVGVYFLFLGDRVVYVGKTTDFFNRMNSHSRGEYEFDSIKFLPVEPEKLDMIEREFIARFAPKYNKVHNKQKEAPVET